MYWAFFGISRPSSFSTVRQYAWLFVAAAT